jgi:hypothetical protein
MTDLLVEDEVDAPAATMMNKKAMYHHAMRGLFRMLVALAGSLVLSSWLKWER